MLNDKTHFAIVQVTYRRWRKGDTVVFDELEASVPSYKTWEDLLDPYTPDPDSDFVCQPDSIFLEGCIELRFCSVGDWDCGWPSFFDQESESIGLQEFVEPDLPNILKSLDPSGNGSILTLWSGRYFQDWEGEWDAQFGYEGVFDPSRLREILK